MSDFFSRNELSRVDRSVTRAPSAISAVQPVSPSGTVRQYGGRAARAPHPAKDDDAPSLDGATASSAEYAKVHARVADILAELGSQSGAITVDGAAKEIQSMLPEPIVLVPLPPASKEAVESSIRIAKRIAEQASFAHAAQANIQRAVVDQMFAPGA